MYFKDYSRHLTYALKNSRTDIYLHSFTYAINPKLRIKKKLFFSFECALKTSEIEN